MLEGERDKLLRMEEGLHNRVVGQDEAVKAVADAIRRSRAGLSDPNRPNGSFLFLGPTGVGKTELCKSLAEFLFDTEDAMVRIDMSEFMEKHSVARLIGAPPGYVGYEEGGILTEKIRRKPYSVILFDEIEKAHPDVFNLLLQVLDEGFLTDSLGRKVDFRNTIVIMTSNIGSRQLKDFGTGVGFSTSAKDKAYDINSKSVIENALKRFFSPEFLNRIDDVIVFNSLVKADIEKILEISVQELVERIKHIGFSISLSKEAKNFLAEKGFDADFGARPLNRAIQKYLEDPLAEEILKSDIKEGDHIKVGYNKKDDVLTFKNESKGKKKTEKSTEKS
jgi:ATP-dependent Clp protease ATP-binding subunit ClpC